VKKLYHYRSPTYADWSEPYQYLRKSLPSPTIYKMATFPVSVPKISDFFTLSQTKLLENHREFFFILSFFYTYHLAIFFLSRARARVSGKKGLTR